MMIFERAPLSDVAFTIQGQLFKTISAADYDLTKSANREQIVWDSRV